MAINVTGVGRRVELALAKAAVVSFPLPPSLPWKKSTCSWHQSFYMQPLGRYVRGYNKEEAPVATGKPALVSVRPVDKFTDCEDNFTVVYFLPDVTQVPSKSQSVALFLLLFNILSEAAACPENCAQANQFERQCSEFSRRRATLRLPGDLAGFLKNSVRAKHASTTPKSDHLLHHHLQFGGFAKTNSILSSAAKLATMLDSDNLPYEEGKFFIALYDGEQQTVCLLAAGHVPPR